MLVLCQSYKCQNKGMLLPNLIDKDVFASVLSEFIINDCSWNQDKEKHIKKDEYSVKDIVCFCILNWGSLIVRVVVVCSKCISLHYHLTKVIIIALINVKPSRMIWKIRIYVIRVVIDHLWTKKGKANNDNGVINDEYKDVLISWDQSSETLSQLVIKYNWKN